MNTNCQNAAAMRRMIVKNEDGYITTAYSVFPGIEFSFTDAHSRRALSDESAPGGNILEIIHCREGRVEFNLNGEFVFLAPGDLMIIRANAVSPSISFPIKHYHGLTIRVDLDKTPHCLSCFLEDVNIQPQALADKFCNKSIGYIARANSSVEHIFSEIYSVSEHIRKGYCKIKTLELLLFLSQMNIDGSELSGRLYSGTQVMLAERIAKYLYEHMDDRITLERLSEMFHVSTAHIKNTFKNVYGVPVGAYVRTIKMESAAYMLEHTDKTILEVAMEHGYDNGSKFAAAFRTVKGANPAQYRSTARTNPKNSQTEPICAVKERKKSALLV